MFYRWVDGERCARPVQLILLNRILIVAEARNKLV
eukprot:SAG11_NODE_1876_length_4137_cov_1.429916_1_plen_34_part_10